MEIVKLPTSTLQLRGPWRPSHRNIGTCELPKPENTSPVKVLTSKSFNVSSHIATISKASEFSEYDAFCMQVNEESLSNSYGTSDQTLRPEYSK